MRLTEGYPKSVVPRLFTKRLRVSVRVRKDPPTNAESGYRLTGTAIDGEETVAVVDRVDPEVRSTFDFPYTARRAGNGVDE